MQIKVIITGATGMVGEGVLIECLKHPDVKEVLMVNRKPFELKDPKLKELIIPDFLKLDTFGSQLKGYDACFFCAGISSVGMSEQQYTKITYNTTIHFAEKLSALNPQMIFNYVSGAQTDSTEKGKSMWARVKGRTENALMRLPFKKVYNFRPGLMKPTPGQKNIKSVYKIIAGLYPIFKVFIPSQVSPMSTVGLAMINSVTKGYEKQILEVKDINAIGKA
jgi:uncharacterized protein YbjT (DUF2867 family)